MDKISSKDFLKIWEKQYGKLDDKLKSKFLKDERLKYILVHSKKDILLAVYSHQKLEEIINFLEHHRKSLSKNQKYSKPDKFDMALNLKKNATKAEQVILKKLNEKAGLRFEFQYILFGYIVDFYFPESSMVVEIDGKIHDNQVGDDAKRSQILGVKDIAVYRFTNEHVLKDSADVLQIILSLANKRKIHQKDFTKSIKPQQGLKEKTIIKTSKARGEILYEIPKTVYLRCESCSTQWSTKKTLKMVCKICKTNKSVVRVCFVCKRNPTPMKISMCNPCHNSRRIARAEVGASKEEWGSGTHRARKLM
jgi:very-short-patch-repair endonuclease